MINVSRKGNVWAGLAAGVAGGLAASWVMTQYQGLWSKLAQSNGKSQRADERNRSEEQSSTEKVASVVSEGLFHRKLEGNQKKAAAGLVHYAFGSLIGAAYGAAAELAPQATAVRGLPFGAAVWLGADEIVVPLLKLGPSAGETPLPTHAYALTSHLAYGAVADGVRRLVRRLWR